MRQQEQGQKYISQLLLQEYGVPDPADKTGQTKILPDYVQKAMLTVLPDVKDMGGVQKVLEKIRPTLEIGKQVDVFNNKATGGDIRSSILANYQTDMQARGQAPDPNVVRFITSEPVTAANLPWFRQRANNIGNRPGATLSPSAPVSPKAQPQAPLSLRQQRIQAETGGPIDLRGGGLWDKLMNLHRLGEEQEKAKDLAFAASRMGNTQTVAPPPEWQVPKPMPTASAPAVKPQARSFDIRKMDLTSGQPVRESLYDETVLAGKG